MSDTDLAVAIAAEHEAREALDRAKLAFREVAAKLRADPLNEELKAEEARLFGGITEATRAEVRAAVRRAAIEEARRCATPEKPRPSFFPR